MAKSDKTNPATVNNENENENENDKRKTRTPMPFGRTFGLTLKFHNDMAAAMRDQIVSDVLGIVTAVGDGENFDTHRSTRGEPNPNLQTWLIAPYGYDWPEGKTVERGVRIPQGPLADALRAYAAKHNCSIEEAAAAFAAAFGDSK